MKKIRLANNVTIKGTKNFKGEKRLIDYYISIPGEQSPIYAFSKNYTNSTYELCKSWIAINKLICTRSRSEGVMNLVEYTRIFLPYLVEEYGLQVAC